MLNFGFDVFLKKVAEEGKPIFPEAFVLTDEEWADVVAKNPHAKIESIQSLKRKQKGQFYGQYLNDPIDDEMIEFKRNWIQTFDPNDLSIIQKLNQVPSIISIDPAFRLSQQSDFSGITVTKTSLDNLVYVLEAKGIKATPQMLVEEVLRLADIYRPVYKILIETVTSQIMLFDLFQQEMKKQNKFYILEEVKPSTTETKAVRIRGLQPHYQSKRIFHAPNLYDLEEQLIEFPKNRNDDIIDSLAYQVKYWHPGNQHEVAPEIKEGSYLWWKKKTPSTIRLGGLFNDFRMK